MFTRTRVLLVLTVLGFVVPNAMVVSFIAGHGVDLGRYFGNWFATLPSAQLVVDLLICCAAFIGWSAWDGPRSGVRRWWLTIPATVLVGLCFAIPLYLLLRERTLVRSSPASGL
jgi:Terpene cyclase DEP1